MKGKYVSLLLMVIAATWLSTTGSMVKPLPVAASDKMVLAKATSTNIVDPHAVLSSSQVKAFNHHNQWLQQHDMSPINVIVLNTSDLNGQQFDDYANQVIDNGQTLPLIMKPGTQTRLPQYDELNVLAPTIWIWSNSSGWATYFSQVPVNAQQFKTLSSPQLNNGKTLALRRQALTAAFMNTSHYIVKQAQATQASINAQNSQNQGDDNQGTAEGPTLFQQSSEDSEVNAQEANHSTSFLSPVVNGFYTALKWVLGIFFFIFMAIPARKHKWHDGSKSATALNEISNPQGSQKVPKVVKHSNDQMMQPSETYTMQTYDNDTDNQLDSDDYSNHDSSSVLGNQKYDKP